MTASNRTAALASCAVALLSPVSSQDCPRGATQLSSGAISASFNVSGAHLSKVMQRLTKVGLLRSTRGPGGGFLLARAPAQIKLLEVYEAVEGPLEPQSCVFSLADCDGKSCILGDVLHQANQRLYRYLATSSLRKVSKNLADREFVAALPRD